MKRRIFLATALGVCFFSTAVFAMDDENKKVVLCSPSALYSAALEGDIDFLNMGFEKGAKIETTDALVVYLLCQNSGYRLGENSGTRLLLENKVSEMPGWDGKEIGFSLSGRACIEENLDCYLDLLVHADKYLPYELFLKRSTEKKKLRKNIIPTLNTNCRPSVNDFHLDLEKTREYLLGLLRGFFWCDDKKIKTGILKLIKEVVEKHVTSCTVKRKKRGQ